MPNAGLLRGAMALLPLLLITAGCTASEQAGRLPSTSPAMPAGRSPGGCLTVTDITVFEPIGTPATSRPKKVGSVDACEVLLDESPIGAATLQVVDLPAAAWAAELGPLIDQLRELITDPEMVAQLDEGLRLLEENSADSDAEACRMFSVMATAHGAPPGSDWVVNYVPGKDAPLAINAQLCVDGRYLSVQAAHDGTGPLEPTDSTPDDLLRIATLLHEN